MKNLAPILLMLCYFYFCYFINPSDSGKQKLSNFTCLVLPACLLYVALAAKSKDIYYFLLFLVVFGLFLTCVAFVFKTINPMYFLVTGNREGRSWTYIQYGPLACSAGLILIVWSMEKKSWLFSRILQMVLGCFCLAGVIYSGERGSILFVPLILLIYFFCSKRVRNILKSRKNIWLVILFLAANISIMRFIQSDQGEVFRDRFKRLSQDSLNSESGIDARLDTSGEFYSGFKRTMAESPIFGSGPGNYFGFNSSLYPHILVLEIGGEYGLLGLGFYLFVLISIIKGMKNVYSFWPPAIFFAYFNVVLLYFFRTFKTGDLAGSRYYWILVSIYIVYSKAKKIHAKKKKIDENFNRS